MAKTTTTDKYVYLFGNKKADGNGGMKPLLGGKGANLAEMTRIGLPVPPGFTITTEVCTYYYANRKTYPKSLWEQVKQGVANTEAILGKRFGDTQKPLLVAVRSGARDSMPGMMDTILNLGLNDQTVLALEKISGNPRFAWIVIAVSSRCMATSSWASKKPPAKTTNPLKSSSTLSKRNCSPAKNTPRTPASITKVCRSLSNASKPSSKNAPARNFPTIPGNSSKAPSAPSSSSWMNDRAIVYRRKYNIPTEWGTAVNVQSMVFGNTGDNSGSGVAFTRDPATGEKVFYGEFLINAQGEDVVAGVRTPKPVAELVKVMPAAFKELERIRQVLESHFRDVQDFEFTIEDGKVFMLQTRNGKRTGLAAVRFAVEMEKEKLISWEEAISRVPAEQLDQVLAPVFDRAAIKAAKSIAKGLPAGPGAATGKIYFNADRAVEAAHKGEKVLLVRVETSPEDLRGMIAAEGILTARGGVSSHAALVARQMGKVCVCGASALHVDYAARTLTVGDTHLKEGDFLSIDGTSGDVYVGELKTAPSEVIQVLINKSLDAKDSRTYQNYAILMKWCAKATRLSVRTNADSPEQAANAVAFGAVGIGLCRTEHMFFEGNRIDAMREMILAENTADRKKSPRQIAPLPARRLHRHFHRAQRPARHHSFPSIRPSMNSCPTTAPSRKTSPRNSALTLRRSPSASTTCMNSTPCSAIAAAASASSIPRSAKCRPAPSSKPPPPSRPRASK